MVRGIDLIQAFEYPSFKIPYEVLNQGFRNLHRDIETKKSNLRKASEKLLIYFDSNSEGNEPLSTSVVYVDFITMSRAWREFHDAVRAAMSQMDWFIESLQNTVYRLRLESSIKPDETKLYRWKIERDRSCRLIVSYLVRCGRLKTAYKLAVKTGLYAANSHEWNQFKEAQMVYDALKDKNTKPCLEWINAHRSKLRKMKSKLEMLVRLQVVVEFLQKGERYTALKYARTHLNIKDEEFSPEDVKEINQIWALLAVNIRTKISAYTALLDDNRFDRLADFFREEFWRLFDLPYQSTFSLSLQCGMAAYKTPQCSPGGNNLCIGCNPTVFTLSEGLPHAHTGQSIIRCAFSGELLNEDNPPWMVLKTGRVYGERSLTQLRRDDKIYCIRSGEMVNYKDVARVYIL